MYNNFSLAHFFYSQIMQRFLYENEYARASRNVGELQRMKMRTTQFSLDFESMHFLDQRSEKLG